MRQTTKPFWQRLSFAARLTVILLSLLISATVVLVGVSSYQLRQVLINGTLDNLAQQTDSHTRAFADWLNARQDEMRLMANTGPTRALNARSSGQLLATLAESSPFYDTIFLLNTEGRGLAGISYEQGRARIMDSSEAWNFHVADRDWFKSAVAGNNVFSQPIISRASGKQVSTVAIPVRHNGQIVGVMRGAVQIDTLVQQLAELPRQAGTEIYLLDGEGRAITPAASVTHQESALSTAAAQAVRDKKNFVGMYRNAAGVAVAGSQVFMPVLGWGLVTETEQQVALAQLSGTMRIMTLIGLAGLVLAVVSSLLLVSNITRALGGDPGYAASIVKQVSTGDLATEISLRNGDSSSLLASISSMQHGLRDTLQHISRHAHQMNDAAASLAQMSGQTNQGIQTQLAELDASATAITEMTASLEEVARNTQDTASATHNALATADAGRTAVQLTLTAIHTLEQEMQNATQRIQSLKQDSDQIGGILTVIEGIAGQTNLLALNAAIEAARAGEAGRGFAVVADEVRNLASRTIESTAEIQAMIERLQKGSDQAVQAVDNSMQETLTCIGHAREMDRKLGDMVVAVQEIDQYAQQIASATEQQTQVSRDFGRSIHNINDIAEQTAGTADQVQATSQLLAGVAEQLNSQVGRFKL